MHIAARENRGNSHFEAIKVLLENEADVNVQTDFLNCTPLHYLVKEANVEVVKLLLDHEANVNVKDTLHKIPLSEAIEDGKFEVVQLLLNPGSDIQNVEDNGITPLHKVATYNSGSSHFDVAELLLKKEHMLMLEIRKKVRHFII